MFRPSIRLLSLAVAGALAATGILYSADLAGVIKDPDGRPVAGAQVVVEQPRTVAWSAPDGGFVLRNVPAGVLQVRVSDEAFEPVVVQIEVSKTGVPTPVELRFEAARRVAANIEVVGVAEDVLVEIPGSVYSISKEELAASKPVDANEVLRRVPGLLVREDSGPAAMRLNVGVRGLNPDRSRQVLMLEDGLPIALAPYGEPEMYYSPPIDRMSRVEVLKGSGQIAYGPQTIGGVINFVTPDPPQRFHGDFDVEGGQRGLFFAQGSLGDSNDDQSAGWLRSG